MKLALCGPAGAGKTTHIAPQARRKPVSYTQLKKPTIFMV
jgi:flagellar biosynthesis GTPase FlhF